MDLPPSNRTRRLVAWAVAGVTLVAVYLWYVSTGGDSDGVGLMLAAVAAAGAAWVAWVAWLLVGLLQRHARD